MNSAVIGLQFGDEGKGKVVSYLSSQCNIDNTIVVRFNGGQQVGHHVVLTEEIDHVFSNFGSGTLQGIPTYWSQYCTIDPLGILCELDILKEKGVSPKLYINRKCPITTFFDKNHNIEQYIKNGTCGVGFGQTLQREEDHYSILAEDIPYPSVLKLKLINLVKSYYYKDITLSNELWRLIQDNIEDTLDIIEKLLSSNVIEVVDCIPKQYSEYIYEGAQGLLLDQNYGFFPNVTRSNTGTTNFMTTCGVKFYLVTRAYQTRHGNGPMTNEDLGTPIKNNPYERNEWNIQGKFRKTVLDLDLLQYSINKDIGIRKSNDKILVITCMDIIKDNWCYTHKGVLKKFNNEIDFVSSIKNILVIDKALTSDSPYPVMSKGYTAINKM